MPKSLSQTNLSLQKGESSPVSKLPFSRCCSSTISKYLMNLISRISNYSAISSLQMALFVYFTRNRVPAHQHPCTSIFFKATSFGYVLPNGSCWHIQVSLNNYEPDKRKIRRHNMVGLFRPAPFGNVFSATSLLDTILLPPKALRTRSLTTMHHQDKTVVVCKEKHLLLEEWWLFGEEPVTTSSAHSSEPVLMFDSIYYLVDKFAHGRLYEYYGVVDGSLAFRCTKAVVMKMKIQSGLST
jgi:hypothetical protein